MSWNKQNKAISLLLPLRVKQSGVPFESGEEIVHFDH